MKKETRLIPMHFIDGCWRLEKQGDEFFEKISAEVKWVEWEENGKFKEEHEKIKVGYSLLMSPFSISYNWLTTPVTDVIENTGDRIEFKTKNSHYILSYDKGAI